MISGLFASLAASCAKVGFDFDHETSTVHNVLIPLVGMGTGEKIEYGIHIVFIVLMICANILMLRFYVLSM